MVTLRHCCDKLPSDSYRYFPCYHINLTLSHEQKYRVHIIATQKSLPEVVRTSFPPDGWFASLGLPDPAKLGGNIARKVDIADGSSGYL